MFNYYLKIVPTVYMRGSNYGEPIYTNQFSVTRYRKDLSDRERGMPGIFFSYELSPLMVKYAEKHKSVKQFSIRNFNFYCIRFVSPAPLATSPRIAVPSLEASSRWPAFWPCCWTTPGRPFSANWKWASSANNNLNLLCSFDAALLRLIHYTFDKSPNKSA